MTPRRWLPLAAALAALSVSACGYHVPEAAVRIGMSAVPADVLYGAGAAEVLPGGASLVLPTQSGLPMRTQASPATVASAPTTVRTATLADLARQNVCPGAASSVVAHPAVGRVLAAPVAQTYPFRASIEPVAPGPAMPVAEARQVSDVSTSGSTITFTVTSRYPGTDVVASTSYQVTTAATIPASQEGSVPVGALAGVAITGQSLTSSTNGVRSTSTVTWTPPLQILKLPAATGQTWAVSSADPHSGETETYSATVTGLAQVNACGALVQGYQTQLSGTLTVPGQLPIAFQDELLIGPQFGGLVLADQALVTTRTSATTSQSQQVIDIIDVTPRLPHSAS